MNNKYLICFDMDGTLLNEKKKISWLTKKHLQKLQKRGHMIVLASGRPDRELRRYYDELGLNSPIVCLNGCYSFSPYDKDFPIYEFSFDKKIAIDISKHLFEIGAINNAFCENNANIWVYYNDRSLVDFFWKTTASENIVFGPFEKTLHLNPSSMLLEDKTKSHREEISNAVKKYKGLNVRFWFGGLFPELYFEGSSKAHTLQKIADFYKIPKDKIIAFGDQHNDIEMIQWAHIGVAMKNASEQLKEHADYITKKDNNHNGIYFALKDIFKKLKSK